jgi:BirA family biotin operon repressor/biotin-[acetyl-CoA-carboxylase] ligase
VLEALRRAGGRSCSGEALSSAQGVSRAQVWKHVETLRRRGYRIEARPGAGYRLLHSPDRLYPEEVMAGLGTRWLGREIHHFASVDSTNRVALELARAGAAHGTCVIAEAQTAGRGRLGRSFFSPPHVNLYTSILLRPELTTDRAPTWILAAASAVAECVAEEVGGADGTAVEIKWPNDVLLGGLKTCGILMELVAEASRVAFLVLGIGVNLNVERERFPAEFRHLATSLAAHTGRRVDRARFTRRLYERLEETLDLCAAGGFEAVRPRFEARFRMAGRPVRVQGGPGGELAGVARGIDADGALLVETSGGELARVIAGDVTLAKGKGV